MFSPLQPNEVLLFYYDESRLVQRHQQPEKGLTNLKNEKTEP